MTNYLKNKEENTIHSFGLNFIEKKNDKIIIKIGLALPDQKRSEMTLNKEEETLLCEYFNIRIINEIGGRTFNSDIKNPEDAFCILLKSLQKKTLQKKIDKLDNEIQEVMVKNGLVDIEDMTIKHLEHFDLLKNSTKKAIIKLVGKIKIPNEQ